MLLRAAIEGGGKRTVCCDQRQRIGIEHEGFTIKQGALERERQEFARVRVNPQARADGERAGTRLMQGESGVAQHQFGIVQIDRQRRAARKPHDDSTGAAEQGSPCREECSARHAGRTADNHRGPVVPLVAISPAEQRLGQRTRERWAT